MPFTPAEERRVARLESDVDSIYEMVGDIQHTQGVHTGHLSAIEHRLDAHDKRFDAIDERFDGVDRRLDGVDQRLDGMDQRFDGIGQQLGNLTESMTEVLRRLPEQPN